MLADRRYVSVTVEPVHRGVHRLIDLILGVGWTNEKPHKPAQ